MKSNVYQIQRGARVLDEIFVESEKVAVYNELNHKQTLQLRLLCEELVNMLPAIVSSFSGVSVQVTGRKALRYGPERSAVSA